MYPGPRGQLAQNALFPHFSACLAFQERVAGCKLPAGSCSWTALSRELSRKMQLGTQVCAEGLSNHFLSWMYFPVPEPYFAAGMQPSCSRIYFQGEMLQVLPSSSRPLGYRPRLFFQILSKCADEGECSCITPLCQWDTAPSRKRSGLQDHTLGRIWIRVPKSCRLFCNFRAVSW